jgi:uncharacterized protein (TIGR02145 family)
MGFRISILAASAVLASVLLSCSGNESDALAVSSSSDALAVSSSSDALAVSSSSDEPAVSSSSDEPAVSSSSDEPAVSSSSDEPAVSSSSDEPAVSSSSNTPSSSSAKAISSSSNKEREFNLPPFIGTSKTTVVIGSQMWMAKNLDVNVPGSKCYGEGGKVHSLENGQFIKISDAEIQYNCAKYGRLYNWSAAMALPAKCNITRSTEDADCVLKTPYHQGICPTDWHIPNNAEWDKLYRYVDGTNGSTSPFSSHWAGEYLRATTGWNDTLKGYIPGTDDYGFFALPGGYGLADGDFYYEYIYGYWWSANEKLQFGGTDAYYRYMYYNSKYAHADMTDKRHFYSIRCLHNSPVAISSSSSRASSSSYVSNVPPPVIITFEDSRDHKVYKSTKIGNQIWMAQNINYETEGSKCAEDNPAYCEKYGRLYTWYAAMDGAESSEEAPSGVQGICPSGWHLPSDMEWSILMNYVNPKCKINYLNGLFCHDADRLLKATDGWYNEYGDGNGTDDYGFSALPGGHFSKDQPDYSGVGKNGYWWSTTESPQREDRGSVFYRSMSYGQGNTYWGHYMKTYSLSVRCVKDD